MEPILNRARGGIDEKRDFRDRKLWKQKKPDFIEPQMPSAGRAPAGHSSTWFSKPVRSVTVSLGIVLSSDLRGCFEEIIFVSVYYHRVVAHGKKHF